MNHPFTSAAFDADPFEGLDLDVSDAVKARLRRRLNTVPWGFSAPRDLQFVARAGDGRLVQKVVLPNRRRNLGIRGVCHAVRAVTGEMISLNRPRIAEARDERFPVGPVQQIAMYVCHVGLRLTMSDIARGFGRDRTTVGYACAKVEDRRDDHAFDGLVAAVERVVNTVFAARESTNG